MKNLFSFPKMRLAPSLFLHTATFMQLCLFLTILSAPLYAQQRVKLKCLNVGFYTQPGQNPNNPNSIIPEAQLNRMLDTLALYTEGIRIFGVDTNLQKVPRLAKARGLKVVVGIWIGSSLTANDKQIKKGIEIANTGDVDRLIVGSEALLRNNVTTTRLIEYINQVKQACPNIPVSTADVYGEFIANPSVVAACSQLDINVYPFWERVPVECALQRFHQSYLSVLAISGGKKIWISETGWKTKGNSQGAATASLLNAVRYNREILGWSKATGIEVCFFSAFDEPWKGTDDGWGIFDSAYNLKPGMEILFQPINAIDSTWLCKKVNGSARDTLAFISPPAGTFLTLKGRVNMVNPCDHKIIIYIKVPGANWWIKPTFSQPSVPILCDGTWEAPYATGGSDQTATDICVFLVPASYKPPLCGGCVDIPADVYKKAISWKCIHRPPLSTGLIHVSKDKPCKGDTITLRADSAFYFVWNDGRTTGSIKVNRAGTYSVTAYDGLGGGSKAEVKIEFHPLPIVTIKAQPDIPVCAGQPVVLTAFGAKNYQWTDPHQTGDTLLLYPLISGSVRVTGTDTNGCSKVAEKYLSVLPLPSVKILNQATTYAATDDSVRMIGQPSNGQFSGNGIIENTFHPALAGVGSHTILYTCTNANGCTNTASVVFTVSPALRNQDLPAGVECIIVFPNPAHEIIKMAINISNSVALHIRLADIYGRPIAVQEFTTNQPGTATLHLNVKGVSRGIYTLFIATENGETWNKKVMIE